MTRSLFSRRRIAALLLSAFLVGCNDAEDALKAPSNVNVIYLLQESIHPKLDFTTGMIHISSFEFTGLRDNADDVHFVKTYPTGSGGTIAVNSPVFTYQQYDIPQGVYSKIEIKL